MGPAALSETVNVVAPRADVLTEHGAGGHQLHAGADEPAAHRAGSQRHAADGSGRPSERARRQLLDQRQRLVREPVPRQRRHAQREPPRHRRPTSTSRTRCRKPPWPRPASPPSSAASAAAWSTSSPSRAATCFSGSFRDTLNNDNWRKMTPFEETAIGGQGGSDLRIDKVVPTYEYTFGGPVMRDRLWFFMAGRLQKQESGRNTAITSIPYTFIQDNKRFEYKGTYSPDSNHRFQAAYTKSYRTEENYTFNQNASMDLASLGTRELPEDLFTFNYTGVVTSKLLRRGSLLAAAAELHRHRIALHRHREGHAAARPQPRQHPLLERHLLRRLHADEQRDNQDIFVKGTYFLSTRGDRLAQHDVRLRQLQRQARRPTTTSRAATTASSAPAPSSRGRTSSRSSSATARRSSSGTRSWSTATARTSARTRCSTTTPGA